MRPPLRSLASGLFGARRFQILDLPPPISRSAPVRGEAEAAVPCAALEGVRRLPAVGVASFRSTPRMNGIGAAVTMRTYRFDPPVTAGGSVRTTTGRLPPAGGRNAARSGTGA